MQKKRILFVDDEPNILNGLRRMLRSMRKTWDTDFACSGREALEKMKVAPYDVVVSDMRMPGMDGAELLEHVKKQYPDSLRFVLSGQSDRETILRSIGPTHQFMSKPTDAETIKTIVNRAFILRELLQSDQLKSFVSKTDSLPSLPHVYTELITELKSPNTSSKKIAAIIEQDLGMTAKILQLVNSAFFGFSHHISNTTEAVTYLGLEALRSLVLMVNIFHEESTLNIPGFSLDAVRDHSIEVGALAQKLAKTSALPKSVQEYIFMAALLHDSGKLVLASKAPEGYAEVLKKQQNESISSFHAEKEVLEATHAEVGAFLLGLWGLVDPIVEAVAFHHTPSECPVNEISPLTYVHVANALVHEKYESASDNKEVDLDYLDRIGALGKLESWREISNQQSDKK